MQPSPWNGTALHFGGLVRYRLMELMGSQMHDHHDSISSVGLSGVGGRASGQGTYLDFLAPRLG